MLSQSVKCIKFYWYLICISTSWGFDFFLCCYTLFKYISTYWINFFGNVTKKLLPDVLVNIFSHHLVMKILPNFNNVQTSLYHALQLILVLSLNRPSAYIYVEGLQSPWWISTEPFLKVSAQVEEVDEFLLVYYVPMHNFVTQCGD